MQPNYKGSLEALYRLGATPWRPQQPSLTSPAGRLKAGATPRHP